MPGRIDQSNQKLELDRSARHVNVKRYAALSSWLDAMDAVGNTVVTKSAKGSGVGDGLSDARLPFA